MNRSVIGKAVLFAICGILPMGAMSQGTNPPVAGGVTLAVAQLDVIANGWRASKLMHASVYNESGQKIGSIRDLIVAPDGSISVAIVDVGGFLGMGKHHVAVPVQSFTQVTPPKIVLPGATKDSLKAMPEFKFS
ncbi:MAG TPA: PRC-barrel domain-containing protein [Burkholderiales bacterium]|nr:PRC-barrel domain-containing protein [Burkholderiales bacterium]HUP09032.1 PRC-barrel domain-containing protein [Caldimonas sp.]